MAIILNLIAFAACIYWFHRLISKPGNKLILPVILVYLASTIACFLVSFTLQQNYLDGLLHLIVSAFSLALFWLWTTIALIVKHAQSGKLKFLFMDLAQTLVLLLFPILIVLMISNTSFKIGG